MSRLFSKSLHLAPLLAAKQPPRCTFPTRGLTASANVFARIAPEGADNKGAFGNAKTENLLTTWNRGRLIDRVSKLEDCADNSDERWIALAKDFVAIGPDMRIDFRDMNARMEAGFAKFKAEMYGDMGAMRGTIRGMRGTIGEMRGTIGGMGERIVRMNKRLDRVDEERTKLGRHVKGIYGAMFLGGFIMYLIETSN